MSASPFDFEAQSVLIKYLEQKDDRSEESSNSALNAFNQSIFARAHQFFSENTTVLMEMFTKMLNEMDLVRFSSNSNILMQNTMKKKFIFIVRGSIRFEIQSAQENTSHTQQQSSSSKQFHRRCFGGKEVELPKTFFSGEAITPLIYERFSKFKEMIAFSENYLETQWASNQTEEYAEVATLDQDKYIEFFGQFEEERIKYITNSIQEAKLFTNLEDNRLAKLASYSSFIEKRNDECVYNQNDTPDEVYIIIEGNFIITEIFPKNQPENNQNKRDSFENFQQPPSSAQIASQKFIIINKLSTGKIFGEDEIKGKIPARLHTVRCVSEFGILISLPKVAYLNCSRELNHPYSHGSYEQFGFPIGELQAQKSYSCKKESGKQQSEDSVDQCQIMSKQINEIENPKLTKFQTNKMQNNGSGEVATINSITKSNKYLQDMLNSKLNGGIIKQKNGESNTLHHIYSTQHLQQGNLNSPHDDLGSQTVHYLSQPKNIQNSSSNNSTRLISQSQQHQQLDFLENSASPHKNKSSIFRARKYQSERQINAIEKISNDLNQKQIQTQYPNNFDNINEEEAKKNVEVLPQKNSIQQFGGSAHIKLRSKQASQGEFVSPNQFLKSPSTLNDKETLPNKKISQSVEDLTLFQSPPKINFTPQLKDKNSFYLENSPNISFKKKMFNGNGKSRADTRIGTFASQEFNYPIADAIENDSSPASVDASTKNNGQDFTSKPGFFGITNGPIKLNLIQRKKPTSVMGSFNNNFQSLKHIEDSDSKAEEQQNENSKNGENTLPYSIQKKSKKFSTLTITNIQDQSEIIPNSNPLNLQGEKRQIHLSSMSTSSLNHISPKKSFIVKTAFSKTPMASDSFGLINSNELNSSKQNSINRNIEQNSLEQKQEFCPSPQKQSLKNRLQHPQRKVKSQKEISASQPQIDIGEGSDSSFCGSENSFKVYDNYTETLIPPEAPNQEKIQPKIVSSKIKPPIPLLDFKTLGENGSQINNFIGKPIQQEAINISTSPTKGKPISLHPTQQENGYYSLNKISGHMNSELESQFKIDSCHQTQSTLWCPSKTLTNFISNKSQEGVTEATTVKLRNDNQKGLHIQQSSLIALPSKRPSTPSIKKLNLSNLNQQIMKQNPQIVQKEDGFSEIQQSRLILPSFNIGGAAQQGSTNQQSNDLMEQDQQFDSSQKQFSYQMKNLNNNDTASFFNTIKSPSGQQNNFALKKSGYGLKQTSMQNINSLYSGLLSSQTYKKKVPQNNIFKDTQLAGEENLGMQEFV